jgi:hypothetical protein
VHNSTEQEYAGVILIGSDEAVGLNPKEAAPVSEAEPWNSDDIAAHRAPLDDPDYRLESDDSDHAVTFRIELSYLDIVRWSDWIAHKPRGSRIRTPNLAIQRVSTLTVGSSLLVTQYCRHSDTPPSTILN